MQKVSQQYELHELSRLAEHLNVSESAVSRNYEVLIMVRYI